MRRSLLLTCFLSLVAPASLSLAQGAPPEGEPAQPAAPAPEEGTAPAPAPAEPAPAPAPRTLEPPQLAPLELETTPPSPGPAIPSPSDAARQLQAAAPPPPPLPPEKKGWTLPETVFHLHGYMRMRGNLLKDGNLGHSPSLDRLAAPDRTNYDPFPFFVPSDRVNTIVTTNGQNTSTPTASTPTAEPVVGGCGKNAGSDGHCGKHTQVSGDMRLRLKPEIHLSDDVRVKAWIDFLDNVGLGTLGYGPQVTDVKLNNTVRVRRAWAEARNRDIGELRFGRMAADWGLGILDNGGDRYGIDSDFSSDVDRVMGITNLGGFYLMAAYDWANEGNVLPGSATPSGVPIDRAQNDDLDVFTFAAAHKLEPEAQQGALLRGEKVFNYGVYFKYSDRLLQPNVATGTNAIGGSTTLAPVTQEFVRLNETQYIPDLWAQFLWEGLRVELEAAFVAGSLEGGCPRLELTKSTSTMTVPPERNAVENYSASDRGGGKCKFRQLGVALESEYRLFDERLGIYFMSGLATGDPNAYGLAATNDPALQRTSATGAANHTIATYQFHPDYRVDLILWRTLMRRVAGGYYFKPGISYDFIHDPYGQRAGGRLDLIYSRASSPKQTWGDSGNLGLEMDLSLYYRSEDGPDPMDGFYGLVQWGILFPFQGLDYAKDIVGAPSSKNAMILRAVAGVAF